MRYLVVSVTTEMVDPNGDFEGSIDEEDSQVADVKGITLCRLRTDVGDAIARSLKDGCDWAVFEVVGNKTERRAVTFEPDGRTVKAIS